MTSLGSGSRWLAAVLRDELDAVAVRIADRIRDEIPEYEGIDEVEENTAHHLVAFLSWVLDGVPVEPHLEFERVVTAQRVESGFDLLPTIAAYRIGELELWEWMLEACEREGARAGTGDVRELAERWFAYGDEARHVTISTYLARERHRTAAEAADRRDLLEDIVGGRVGESEMRSRLHQLGCELGAVNVVVTVSLPASPLATMRERAQRFATRLESALSRATGRRPFLAITHAQVTGLVPWERSPQAVAEALRRVVAKDDEAGVRAGVSLPVSASGDLRGAYEQAVEALALSSSRRPTTVLAELRAFDYVVETASSDVLDLAPAAVRRALSTDDDYAKGLADTITVYMQTGMRARETAELLHVHTNTVYYRLAKIEELFEVDVHDHAQLLDLLIYIRVFRQLGGGSGRMKGR